MDPLVFGRFLKVLVRFGGFGEVLGSSGKFREVVDQDLSNRVFENRVFDIPGNNATFLQSSFFDFDIRSCAPRHSCDLFNRSTNPEKIKILMFSNFCGAWML